MPPIVTRFAPSPTGMLHIGGVRTALINWLFAHQHSGKYLVRIEDTDRKRSTPEAISAIEQGLKWLGMASDEKTAYQSERLPRHCAVAEQLLQQNKAYRCTCTPEELETMRTEARAEGRTRMYDRRCREKQINPDLPSVVRLKVPTSGKTDIDDVIQGRISIDNDHLDDYILLRADGTPTYMLSCVVDDADMQVSHIIRGDDHINNAFRQLQLVRAAGFPEPIYAHLALLHGDDGAKLSKRHGALGIAHYKESGYLPEAILNYLLRLGWGKGEEILSIGEATKIFTLEDMNKSPARVDFARLNFFNASYLRSMATEEPEKLLALCAEFTGLQYDFVQQEILQRGLPALSQRSETLQQLCSLLPMYSNAPTFPIADAKAEKQFLAKGNNARFDILIDRIEIWCFDDASSLKNAVAAYVTEREVGFGTVGQPLRIALCGTMQAPDIGDILLALGRQETQKRLHNAVAYLSISES